MPSDPPQSSAVSDGSMSRRALIRKAGVAAAIGWTAPLIIESLASPAGAVSATPGCYWVAYQQTTPRGGANDTANHFSEMALLADGTYAFCQPPVCPSTGLKPVKNVSAASVGLSVSGGPIYHQSLSGATTRQPATFTIAGGFSCRIVGVNAVLDQEGTGNGGNCFGTATNLLVGPGSLGTTTVTVTPGTTVAFTPGQLHWGAFGGAGPPTSPSGAVLDGYIVVTIQCP